MARGRGKLALQLRPLLAHELVPRVPGEGLREHVDDSHAELTLLH